MKKEYEKPIAELVVFEMSDAISSCSINIRTDPDIPENIFAKDDCEKPVEEYCYNTSVEALMNS